jgi:tetratricopeptide (TPR) repeat protein
MIPTDETLRKISRMRDGALAEIPFAVVLHALALRKKTVLVELRRRQIVKTLFIEEGVIIDCRSNLLNETLGRFLVARKLISEEQYDSCVPLALSRHVPLGELLSEKGILDASELFRFLQQNLAKKLLDLFSWREGDFRILRDVPEVESTLKVRIPQLIVTGISRFSVQQEADLAIAPLVGKKLILHPAPPFPLAELKLSPVQTRLADALKPGRRVDELAAVTAIPIDEISRILYALALIGAVVSADTLPAAAAGAAAPAVAAPARPAQAPVRDTPSGVFSAFSEKAGAVRNVQRDRAANDVMQAFLAHRRRDAFELLGVTESDPESAVAESFLAYAERFAPWHFTEGDLATLSEKARDLFFAGARAYATLHDPDRREALVSRRRALKDDVYKKPAQNPFAIKTDLLNPELQFRKGRELIAAKKYRDAVTFLEFAADCDPQNGAYKAELAYCRYLDLPTLTSAPLRELEETLRLDPHCGIAAFYAGEIQRIAGRREEAEASYKKAFKLMPRDPRPGEALTLLSKTRKK